MKPYLTAAIAILIIGIVLIAFLMGFIPGIELGSIEEASIIDDQGTPAKCDYPERDIYTALCGLTGRSLNYLEAQQYMDMLSLKLCGVNDKTPSEVTQDFRTNYAAKGLTVEYDEAVGGEYWAGYLTLWSHQGILYGVTTGSGAAVDTVFDQDTMYLTGKGTETDWYNFIVWMTS